MKKIRHKLIFTKNIVKAVCGSVWDREKDLFVWKGVTCKRCLKKIGGVMSVPKFKSTEEAVAYGQKIKGDKKLIWELWNAKEEAYARSSKFLEQRDLQKALDSACECQLIREALESVDGNEIADLIKRITSEYRSK